MVPDAGTLPTPLLMDTEDAFVVDQVRVDDPPLVIELGLADKLAVGIELAVPTVMFSEALAGTLPLLSQN